MILAQSSSHSKLPNEPEIFRSSTQEHCPRSRTYAHRWIDYRRFDAAIGLKMNNREAISPIFHPKNGVIIVRS